MKNNIVGWFEIPVTDMERAIKFYEKVLDIELEKQKIGKEFMAWFPFKEDGFGASGTLIKHEQYKPSKDGVLIYLTPPSGDLSIELSRVENAGGTVFTEKTLISEEYGYYGLFIDSEGNRIGIHSRQ